MCKLAIVIIQSSVHYYVSYQDCVLLFNTSSDSYTLG